MAAKNLEQPVIQQVALCLFSDHNGGCSKLWLESDSLLVINLLPHGLYATTGLIVAN